jgi:hypothetical protein
MRLSVPLAERTALVEYKRLAGSLAFDPRVQVGYLYNPVSAELVTIPGFPDSPRLVLWDAIDR